MFVSGIYSIKLYCRNTRIFGWTKTFWIDNLWHYYQIAWQCCLCVHVVGRFSKDFSEVRGFRSRGFSFRLNGWQQYYARNYEKKFKCQFINPYSSIQKIRKRGLSGGHAIKKEKPNHLQSPTITTVTFKKLWYNSNISFISGASQRVMSPYRPFVFPTLDFYKRKFNLKIWVKFRN